MEKAHNVESVSFSDRQMHLCVDGRDYVFRIADISDRLRRATQRQRENFEVSPSGYGIHWPEIDEDLSIDGVVGIRHTSAPSVRTRRAGPRRKSKTA